MDDLIRTKWKDRQLVAANGTAETNLKNEIKKIFCKKRKEKQNKTNDNNNSNNNNQKKL